MLPDEAKSAISQVLSEASASLEVARTATRNRKSLAGSGFYSDRFHEKVIALQKGEGNLEVICRVFQVSEEQRQTVSRDFGTLKSPSASNKERTDAHRNIRMFCEVEVLPAIDRALPSPTPTSESILPLAVVRTARVGQTRSYLEKILMQANGCYERQWYDACAVMVRRLVETLIIELYESKGRDTEIKNSVGDFLMLRDLVKKVVSDTSFNLCRESKRVLPLVKDCGDRSAHNRRYTATRADLDGVIPGLRVLADDLLHLAGLK